MCTHTTALVLTSITANSTHVFIIQTLRRQVLVFVVSFHTHRALTQKLDLYLFTHIKLSNVKFYSEFPTQKCCVHCVWKMINRKSLLISNFFNFIVRSSTIIHKFIYISILFIFIELNAPLTVKYLSK